MSVRGLNSELRAMVLSDHRYRTLDRGQRPSYVRKLGWTVIQSAYDDYQFVWCADKVVGSPPSVSVDPGLGGARVRGDGWV
jgi:hypothetical protein